MQDTSGARANRFAQYILDIAGVLGDPRRNGPMTSYCTGLLMPADRKSVEPMAALTAPERTAAQHQSLLHFVGKGDWSDEAVLAKVREHVVPKIETHGAISAWLIDDTSFAKKGKHSVGVARQYCGQLGKQDNCQVAVSLSIANESASLPVAYALYLPESWADDAERRAKAGVPTAVAFKTKPQIALDQLGWACANGLPRGDVIADAGYGAEERFRAGITELGLRYVVGIKSTNAVWTKIAIGNAEVAMRMSVERVALTLPDDAWRTLRWRQGTNEKLSGRFARVRVRVSAGAAEEWLLIEWPQDEPKPAKYWLSTLRPGISFAHLVSRAKRNCSPLTPAHPVIRRSRARTGGSEQRGWR
jgi:SRSO17 transposase